MNKPEKTIDRLIALEPNNIDHQLSACSYRLPERADTRPLHAFEKIVTRTLPPVERS